MGKKMKLISSVFKNKDTNNPWQKWASCTHPRTLSIRADETVFKTVNSVYLDQVESIETQEYLFTNSSQCASFTTETEEFDAKSLEMVVKGVRTSERLFFEPGDTSSILEEAKLDRINPFNESIVILMESNDPYMDFRRSMEEMVESHGLKDWKCLEELLGWYLRVNGKDHHGYIIGAFVDILVGHASSCYDSKSFFNDVSSSACPFGGQNEIHEDKREVDP